MLMPVGSGHERLRRPLNMEHRTESHRCRLLHIALIAGISSLAGCNGGGAAPPGPFYDWPIPVDAAKTPSKLYSNLGEFRGAGDSPFWYSHGATDFVAPRGTRVFSPDKGQVRFGEQSASNAGQPPVKIGRFSFLHFTDINNLAVNPAVLGDPTLWTWVVDPTDPIFIARAGQPVQTTLQAEGKKSLRGVRRNTAGTWEDVFWFSRTEPIGLAGSEPDLHVIYYDDPAAAYSSRGSIRNVLAVIAYRNTALPNIQVVRFYSQKPVAGQGRERILDSENMQAVGVMDTARHGGLDIVVTCSSFNRDDDTRAGIYKLAYAIHRFLTPQERLERPPEAINGPGGKPMLPIVPETVMWTYDRLPEPSKDRNLLAERAVFPLPGANAISSFNLTGENQTKHSAYVVTNTAGDDALHWELENIARYPDGDYLVTISAWNIARSQGIGLEPQLNRRDLQLGVRVNTTGTQRSLRLARP